MKPVTTKQPKKAFSLEFFVEAGRKGGKTKSAMKARTARLNGKKGGRPKVKKKKTETA